MKIMHVTKKYPNALGGDAVVVKNLELQQRAAGHDVVVVTSNCDAIQNTRTVYKVGLKDTAAGLDAITPKRIFSLFWLALKIFFILRKERPDIIHTHSIDMAFFVSFAARWFKIPVIHTFHIVTFYDAAQSPLRRKTELWLAKKAGLAITTAPNTYDVKKLRLGGLHNTALLPNGVDVDFWQKTSARGNDDTFTFVSVGRLEAQKGYEHLINAAAMVAKMTARPFKIIIIGEGSLRASLARLIHDERLTHVVDFVGRKNPQEILAQFSKADAVVCTSLYETTPLTLLEAWAAGLPVIATRVGILRDIPDTFRSAYIVAPQNPGALASVMRQCMTDDTMRAAVAQSGQDEVQKYRWPTIAQTAEQLYRSTI